MDALKDGPKHGYEIIKTLEDRSSGQYTPSAGMVYPAMQFLEDLGLVRSDQQEDRRVYALTDTGRAELEAHAEEVSAFWARFAAPVSSAASQTEVGFLQEELEQLNRTVWNGLKTVLGSNNPETVRSIRQAIERCQAEIRGIMVSAVASPEAPNPNE